MPFNKFPGIDPILGPEMKSTGEVMGTGDTFAAAFAQSPAWVRVMSRPQSGLALFSVRDVDKAACGCRGRDGWLRGASRWRRRAARLLALESRWACSVRRSEQGPRGATPHC